LSSTSGSAKTPGGPPGQAGRFPFSPPSWRKTQIRIAKSLAVPGRHQARELGRALAMALGPAASLFASACAKACPTCREVCCARISPHGLLDTPDLVYFAAILESPLPFPDPSRPSCPFLGGQGCELPWPARPAICLNHICPDLEGALGAQGLALARSSLQRAGELRDRMMAAYLA